MKSNVNFKIINPNTKEQVEDILIDIVVQQLIRKEENNQYIEKEKELAK